MNNLEVIARFKIRPGRLDGFKAQLGEILRETREKDTHTLRCDWFIKDDETACEVHELFPNEQGLIEHKMNTMESTEALFKDIVFDHHATIYGDVSQDFINLVTARMGAPTVYTFLGGLDSRPTPQTRGVRPFEVKAGLKVRPGELVGFRRGAAEMLRLTREQDTKTLRYDWFINQDETECEVHEAYLSESGLMEHSDHVIEVRSALFRNHAFDHRMTVYGDISPHLDELFQKHAGGVTKFSFVQGLELPASV